MGPGSHSRSDVPSRPRFTWDLRNCPWTDGKGSQEAYATALSDWSEYHDILPSANANKVAKNLRGLQLKSQLFDRAADLIKDIPRDVLVSEKGADAIVADLYKRDPLSVVTDVFGDYSTLMNTRRGANESFKNFESRFSAAVSRYSAHGKSIALPDAIKAFLLLSNANVSEVQRVPVLSAAASKAAAAVQNDASSSSNDVILSLVEYESVASVIRQCDSKADSGPIYSSHAVQNGNRMSGNRVNTGNRKPFRNVKSKMSRQELRATKLKTRCVKCGKYGHWHNDHAEDGSVKFGLPSLDQPSNSRYGNANRNHNNEHHNSGPSQNNGNVMKFGMVSVDDTVVSSFSSKLPIRSLGPLVDDGGPFSAIGNTELCLLRSSLGISPLPCLDPVPRRVEHFAHWQYGTGEHASAKRRILGSVEILCRSDLGRPVAIRYLVLEGSSQWVIGRNVTRSCNILHDMDNRIQFPKVHGIQDYITMCDSQTHSYITLERFTCVPSVTSGHSSNAVVLVGHQISTAVETPTSRPLSELRRIVRRVHDHVCGDASYGNMRTLLQRNKIWNVEVQKLLSMIVEHCEHCIASSPPTSDRKVSISGINRGFNDVVCIDHFHLDDVRLFHVMDSYSRFSAALPVSSMSLSDAIAAFEAIWISHFWPPCAVQGDLAFRHNEFQEFLAQYGTSFRPVPPRRHHKNLLESKHGFIRAIFLRLKSASASTSPALLATMSVRISNEMYGSDTMSSFELAKCYSKPVDSSCLPKVTPKELIDARDCLLAKRKLTLMLRSQATRAPVINPGDLVDVFVKKTHEKRGRWLSLRTVLSVDNSSSIVSVPGLSGHSLSIALEDVRHSIVDDEFAEHVRQSNDQLQSAIDEAIDFPMSNSDELDQGCLPNLNETTFSPDFDQSADIMSSPVLGDRLEVFWPLDDSYYPGTVTEITDDGCHVVDYDDGNSEKLNLSVENWRSSSILSASYSGFPSLQSDSFEVLQAMLETIGQKPIMLHHAQGFPQYVVLNAFQAEEKEFKKYVKCIPVSDVPPDANIISSYTVYKIKVENYESLRLKARIAPHGN